MEATRQNTNLTFKGTAHWIALLSVSATGAAVVLVSVVLVAMGPTGFKASLFTWLDDQHISGPRTEMLRTAQRLERADAVEDARKALAAGDSRLYAVGGMGLFFPGAAMVDVSSLQRRYGAKEVLYSGCVSESTEEERYRTVAHDYAAAYNRAILAQVQR